MNKSVFWMLVVASAFGSAQAAPKSKSVPPPAKAAAGQTADDGTTIIGDQESPIGLYITPWKDEYAQRGLDRPARLLDESLLPIDPATFRRQIDYYEKLDEASRFKRASAAPAPAP